MRFGIHWLHGDIPERTGEVLALAAKDGDLLAMKLVAYLTKLRFTRRE